MLPATPFRCSSPRTARAARRGLQCLSVSAEPTDPGAGIVSEILLRDFAERLINPLLGGRVQIRILTETDQLGYCFLAEFPRQHSGIGKVARGALAQVVRRIVVEHRQQWSDGAFRAQQSETVDGRR